MICFLIGHKFVPINDHQQFRVMICMRCAKQMEEWVDPAFRRDPPSAKPKDSTQEWVDARKFWGDRA